MVACVNHPSYEESINRRMMIHTSSDIKKKKSRLALVAHACNPSCSGGRVQEDHGLLAQANNSGDLILKIPNTKKGLVYMRPWVQSQKREKEREKACRCWWLTSIIYSGGRDQEDHSLKPARGNSLRDAILKIESSKHEILSSNPSIEKKKI
jgi:hypothetical protein